MTDYDDYEDDDQQVGMVQPWQSQSPNDLYMNEALVRQSRLCETDIKPYSISQLEKMDMSQGFIDSMQKVVMSAFDNSKILARLSSEKGSTMSPQESIIRLRIRLNLGKLHYETFDLDSPWSLTLPEDILNDSIHYITRAEKGWENELQHKYQTAQELTSTQIIKDNRGGPPRKKMFGLFG